MHKMDFERAFAAAAYFWLQKRDLGFPLSFTHSFSGGRRESSQKYDTREKGGFLCQCSGGEGREAYVGMGGEGYRYPPPDG